MPEHLLQHNEKSLIEERYPITVGDLQRHFFCSYRTALRYAKALPRDMRMRTLKARDRVRMKQEAIHWLVEYNRKRRSP